MKFKMQDFQWNLTRYDWGGGTSLKCRKLRQNVDFFSVDFFAGFVIYSFLSKHNFQNDAYKHMTIIRNLFVNFCVLWNSQNL